MKVKLLYFRGCPNWQAMADQLDRLATELNFTWTSVLVETPAAALDLEFYGSPSLHVNGVDPFATPNSPVGLACRVYRTASGPSGTPDDDDLRRALLSA